MKTNIEIDDNLLKEAFKYTNVKTRKDLINLALKEFIVSHKKMNFNEIKGKLRFEDSYNYKAMR